MKPLYLSAVITALLAACGPSSPALEPADPAAAGSQVLASMTLETAVASDLRSEEERARDVWRNPIATLGFFGVQSDLKVVEIWPGGGWYTNILAPWIAAGGGQLVLAGFDPESVSDPERRALLEQRIAEFRANYDDPRFGNIEHTVFSANSGPFTEPGSADVVLTFRNVHNWMANGYAEKFFADAFEALKPGGTLGVVEHRLPSTETQDPRALSGYVHEDFVKALAEAAGFEFVGSTEINANPRDTADHPFGVWTLPPVSRTSNPDGTTIEDFDPAIYNAIGESDRMTLRFRKPA
jgi:predicted methyltransferase